MVFAWGYGCSGGAARGSQEHSYLLSQSFSLGAGRARARQPLSNRKQGVGENGADSHFSIYHFRLLIYTARSA